MTEKETSAVLTKTTKPKVIIQTKKLENVPFSWGGASGSFRRWKWIWYFFIVLLLLVNAVISLLNYFTSREHLRFTVMSNGGLENYVMLQNLYASPDFQQASTISIYQLVDRINQTLASAQWPIEEAGSL